MPYLSSSCNISLPMPTWGFAHIKNGGAGLPVPQQQGKGSAAAAEREYGFLVWGRVGICGGVTTSPCHYMLYMTDCHQDGVPGCPH
ncbi:hypothetical protein FKM82_030727 [Ascaphus truei]